MKADAWKSWAPWLVAFVAVAALLVFVGSGRRHGLALGMRAGPRLGGRNVQPDGTECSPGTGLGEPDPQCEPLPGSPDYNPNHGY